MPKRKNDSQQSSLPFVFICITWGIACTLLTLGFAFLLPKTDEHRRVLICLTSANAVVGLACGVYEHFRKKRRGRS